MFPTLDDALEVDDVLAAGDSSGNLEAPATEPRPWSNLPPVAPSDDSDAVATQKRERLSPSDDVFQKIR